jgi:hypothetical protein
MSKTEKYYRNKMVEIAAENRFLKWQLGIFEK